MADHKLLLLMLATVIGDDRIPTVKRPTRDTATFGSRHKLEESSHTGESKRMAHKEVQTGSLPFVSQAPPPAWTQMSKLPPIRVHKT